MESTVYLAPLFIEINFLRITLLIALITGLCILRRKPGVRKNIKNYSNQRILPSPPTYPIIGSAHLVAWSGDLLNFVNSMFIKYGKIWKANLVFGHEYVFIADADMVQKLLSHNSPHVDKPHTVNKVLNRENSKGSLFMLEGCGDLWKSHRKILSEAFTYKALKGYVDLINKHAESVAKKLPSHTGDFDKLIHTSALHMITDITFGPEICDEGEYGSKLVQLASRILQIFGLRFSNPWLLIAPIWKLHPKYKEMIEVRKEVDTLVSKKIQAFQQCQMSRTVDGSLISNDSENEEIQRPFHSILQTMLLSGEMTSQQILTECIGMLGAGHDTTSKSMELLMFHLALNPYHQTRCRDEIDRIAEKHDFNKSGAFRVSMDSLTEMKYLENCIKESSRLTPIAPLVTRELKYPLTLDEDIELDVGTSLIVSAWTLHRDPGYFPNPEKFDPDRFLPENVKNMHPYAFIPFSAGKRNCIGYKLAIMELKAFSAWILRHFEVETGDKLEDIAFKFGIILRWKGKINLVFKPRKLIDL